MPRLLSEDEIADVVEDRRLQSQDDFGLGFCNITKCCTEVCPEHIRITDNGIIPLKERVVDRGYDPLARLVRRFRKGRRERASEGDAAESAFG